MTTIATTYVAGKPPTKGTPTGSTPNAEHEALPPGTRIDEFEILRVLGIGGFGIVYLAMDHALQRHVAIKEYMPTMLASRNARDVQIRSEAHAETFAIGLRSFVNEAQLLAGFDHPSLVKVFRFWQAHGTAYMAMQYYQGRTLHDERRTMHGAPCEAWLRGVTDPLLSALEQLHGKGVFHRDISPDNIIVLPNGQPVLLDFGAARRVIGDRTQLLTAILKPSFAPIEQYADVAGMRQGAWTDLYALGAVVYFMLKGKPPAPAVARAVRDEMPTLESQADAALSGVSQSCLRAIDWALTIAPEGRPQDVAALRAALDGKFVPQPRSRHGETIAAGSLTAASNTRRVVLTIAILACATVALAAWKLSQRVVAPTPITIPATKTPTTPKSTTQQRATANTARSGPSAQASDPQLACADRNFVARTFCVSRQCLQPQFAHHPVCVELQRAEQAREQAQRNR